MFCRPYFLPIEQILLFIAPLKGPGHQMDQNPKMFLCFFDFLYLTIVFNDSDGKFVAGVNDTGNNSSRQ